MSQSNATFAAKIVETLHLETIKITNFKNYESANLTFSPQLNAFVGLNGTGKTNLLDAIYYACMCKSYFLAADSDVILRGSDFLRIDATFQKQDKRERIVAKVQARKRKIFERNDVAYAALSDHIGLLPVVMIAPDDTDLIKEGSEERRRFVDNALSQLDNLYLRHLMFYNKIVEQRNATLKKWSETNPNHAKFFEKSENTEGSQKSNWQDLIDTYDSQLVASANYIFEKRQAFIADFEPIFNHFYKKITDERETVSIVYESQLLTDNLSNLLQRNRQKDCYLQRTSVGIHRDNLGFEMNGKPLRKFGSQGQLKSFVIALKLAQYHIIRLKNLQLNNYSELNLINKNELNISNELINKNALDTTNSLALRNSLDKHSELSLDDNINSNNELDKIKKNNTSNSELILREDLNTHFELELNQELAVNNAAELNNLREISNDLQLSKGLKINSDSALNKELAIKSELNNSIEIDNDLALNKELVINAASNNPLALDSLLLNDKPLLLLDDIFDKLDERRVQNLVQLIVSQQFGQIFITDTHTERIEKLGTDLGVHFKKFNIDNGIITIRN